MSSDYQSSLEDTVDRQEEEIEKLKQGIKKALDLLEQSFSYDPYDDSFIEGLSILEKLINDK